LVFGKELVQVNLPNGIIEGKFENDYYSFKGVPYAEPPIGTNRFQPPKPYTKLWTKPYKAVQAGNICMQLDYFTPPENELIIGDEDCLYLNVFTKSLNHTSRLPVLFFIHGGAFNFGYAMLYGEKILLTNHNGIVVTMNYRLGPLGFLSTQNNIVPGNMGLKDQQTALEWTYKNIEKFGGDPNNIVVYGQSAGSASAHFHYLNKKSNQFMSKAVLLSGTAINSWAITENNLERARTIAQHLNCTQASVEEMVECLKLIPGADLVRSTNFIRARPFLRYPFVPFGPTIEPASDHAIITAQPIDVIESRDYPPKPIVFSITSGEGYLVTAELLNIDLSVLDQAWNKIMPYILDYYATIAPNQLDVVSQKIRDEYLGDKPLSRATIERLTEISGDRLFKYDVERAAKLHANRNRNNTYFVYFTYGSSASVGNVLCQCKNYKFTAVHTDDLFLIMNNPLNIQPSENDRVIGQQMVDMLYNFASTSQLKIADVLVPPMQCRSEHFNYVNINGPNDISIKVADDFGNYKFWKTLEFAENL
jgi:carboxylesterase type B